MDQSQQIFCNKCFTPLPAGVRFCPECGSPAPQKVVGNCSNCGQPLMEGQTTCFSCGALATPTETGKPKPKAKKKKTISSGVWMSILALLLVAIITVTVVLLLQPQNAESIQLEAEEWSMLPGQRIRLQWEILPENTKDKSVTWESENENVAIVKNGEVVAVDVGVCTITVTTANGLADSCTIVVSDFSAEALVVQEQSLTLHVKDRAQLECTVLPQEATSVLTWQSDNTAVAQVEDGLVKAVGLGSCTITVTADNGVSTQCKATVELRSEERLPLGQWQIISIENRYEDTRQDATDVSLTLGGDLQAKLNREGQLAVMNWWYVNVDSDGDHWYDTSSGGDLQMVYNAREDILTLYMEEENWVFERVK